LREKAFKTIFPMGKQAFHGCKTIVLARDKLSTSPHHISQRTLCPCGGGCPRCGGAIQAKLKIGEPNDVYEQEADRC